MEEIKTEQKEQMQWYDGTKLLSLSDSTGARPEVYFTTGNRSAGKTTYFNRLSVNRFLKKKQQFALLYRFNYELQNVGNKFFNDVGRLFFPGYTMTDKPVGKDIYRELYLHAPGADEKDPGMLCGYALDLNASDQIRKWSHAFIDVGHIVFDEFQSESNHYCNDEITKFMSVHTSIARGGGSAVRRVPIYMISNTVSLLNPYYTASGIGARLHTDTKFLRGDGFVLEQTYNRGAAELQKQSGFNRTFAKSKYVAYASENVYLNDNLAFIDTPSGKNNYYCTFDCDGVSYGIREYLNEGVVYVDKRPDLTARIRIAATTEDHRINYVMLKKNDLIIQNLRTYFKYGCMRFKDLECKDAFFKLISL